MRSVKHSRRMFLCGTGGALMTIPFLPSLAPRSARAQEASQLKYVLMSSNYCVDQDGALPFPANHKPYATVTQLDDATSAQSLDEIVAKRGFFTSSIQGQDWDNLRPYMNIAFGTAVNGTNDKHNSCAMTAASMPHDVLADDHPRNDNPVFKFSADYLAERLLATPQHAYGALRMNLAFRHGADFGYVLSEYQNFAFGGPSASDPRFAERLPTMRDVAQLEQKLTSLGSSDGESVLERKSKLIDAVRDDYRSVIKSNAIGTDDRQRLEQAIELWNEAENRLLKGTAGSSCGAPDLMTASGDVRASWAVYHDYALDLCAYALACRVTPVISYALLHTSDDGPDNGDEHLLMHSGAHDDRDKVMAKAMPWRLARVARFANRLLELKDENDVSLLESTLISWGHEYAAPGAHPNAGHWTMMLGRAGGSLQTGNFLNLSGTPVTKNYYTTYHECVPYNRVLLTQLLALGHTNESIEAITGSVGFGEYGTVANNTNDHRQGASFGWSNAGRARFYTDAEKRKPLPILRVT